MDILLEYVHRMETARDWGIEAFHSLKIKTLNSFWSFLSGECEAVSYCSKICQRKRWTSQKGICKATSDLTVKQNKKVKNIDVYNSFYTPKQKTKLVNLIGRKSTVNCFYLIQVVKFYGILEPILVLLAKAMLDKSFHIWKSES